MEFQIVFPFFVFIISFFHLFITKLIRSTDHDNTNNLLPQPRWKLPFLGHLHYLLRSHPHRALGNLAQKLGPVFRLQLGEITTIVISSPDIAKQVMQTHDLCFANRPKIQSAEIVGYNYTDIVFSPYGEYWRQMRKICILELLSVKRVRSLESIREQESWSIVESMVNDGRPVVVNLTEKIFTMMNMIALRVTVGSRCEDQGTLLALIQQILSLSSSFDVSDSFPSVKMLQVVTGMRKKLMNIHAKIDKILDGIISNHVERHRHRAASGQTTDYNEDLLDVLLRIKDEGGNGFQSPLTHDNIKAVILDMFTAGTDTSSVIIEWTMFELMRNPGLMKKAQTELRNICKGKKKICESDIQDLDYLRLIIKETLRLHPPLPLLPRECREKCKIGGYDIPANARVIINAWTIGCDPIYWTDPESFMPERFSNNLINFKGTDFEYLPFGAGRRMCPGIAMGIANVELPLARLLYHFNWELPNKEKAEDLDVSEAIGATLKRKSELHLVAIAYNTN